ncbi:MAG: RNA-guided pseudouridylation complex pseudouridine synthase subunit Cbf5 [Candidatus Altiarchaeota archaeon]|nr:RNA-guided pseudouridylation complex pseudouridine synthase subunit Cbf5 [Candidatus Altiarchaeota archaeon]
MNPIFLKVDHQILVKSAEDTDPKYGCPPEQRPIQEYIRKAIVNVDKPSGPSSHEVSARVKDIFKFDKVGHSGTLDPKVTGVLPVAMEEGTKILQALLVAGKQYVTLMKLHGDTTNSQIKKTLSYFQTEIYQKPPLKSAVKRQLRTRRIYNLRYMEREGDYVLYTVDCEAGTYIRKLCHDIGLILGVGAHMQELRRTKAGPYTEETLVTLHDLRDAFENYKESKDESELRRLIQPMESAVVHLPKIWVKDSAISALCHGASLAAPGVSKLTDNIRKDDLIAIFSLKNELVALAKALQDSQTILKEEKGEVATLERVTMHTDTYPKGWSKKTN